VPHTWIRALGVPTGASLLRLHDPSVAAAMVLVTNAAEPGSVVTRALVQIARDASTGGVFGPSHQA
jgi:hypothetical protein